MASHIDKPQHTQRLIRASQPMLPGDGEREQALLPRFRRSRIQQPAVAALDHPAPDAHKPLIHQTHQLDQPCKPLVLGDRTLAQLEGAALPIAKQPLEPHPTTAQALGLPVGLQGGHQRIADQLATVVLVPPGQTVTWTTTLFGQPDLIQICDTLSMRQPSAERLPCLARIGRQPHVPANAQQCIPAALAQPVKGDSGGLRENKRADVSCRQTQDHRE
jgi:hypothetical protein